jgi:ligand-binding SRPBCC domain-containing protein
MPTLVLETFINAPAQACFDLVRDVRIHERSTSRTGDRDEDGTIGLGQKVTFESRHFGVRQRLTVAVVEFERPRRFVDEMTEGGFKSFRHVHEFVREGDGTLMRDTLVWESPYGILGRAADKLLLTPHLRRLVSARNAKLKLLAETASIA